MNESINGITLITRTNNSCSGRRKIIRGLITLIKCIYQIFIGRNSPINCVQMRLYKRLCHFYRIKKYMLPG